MTAAYATGSLRSHVRFVCAVLLLCGAAIAQTPAQTQQPRTRRSQRVRMQEVQVTSPDGNVRFTIQPNAERLTYTVMMGNTVVLRPSPIIMILDGYDLLS